jgi:hypothetical protein
MQSNQKVMDLDSNSSIALLQPSDELRSTIPQTAFASESLGRHLLKEFASAPIFCAIPQHVETVLNRSNTQKPEQRKISHKYDQLMGKFDVTVSRLENSDKNSIGFYDTKITTLSYADSQHGQLQVVVSGKGRQEKIEVFKKEQTEYVKMIFSEQVTKNILSMNGTFSHHEIHLLDELLVDGAPNKTQVLPYIEVSDHQKFDIAQAAAQLRDLLDYRLNIKPETTRIILPVLSNQSHWFMVSLDVHDQNHTITPTIINSTNDAKANQSLDDVLNNYGNIQELIKTALKTSEFFKDKMINDFQFGQSLQYGNMGCGITTMLNMQAISSGELSIDQIEFTQSSFYSENERKFQLDFVIDGKAIRLTDQKASLLLHFHDICGNNQLIPLSLLENDHYGEQDLFNDANLFFDGTLEVRQIDQLNNLSTPGFLKKDTSNRSSLELETIRRVDLAFLSEHKSSMREAINRQIET